MTGRQRHGGLGRGLGSLIPTAPPAPVDPPPEPATSKPGTSEPATPDTATLDQSRPGTPTSGRPPLTSDTGETDFGAVFAELPVTSIHPNARQPRQVFDEDALSELTHSVREFGVLQPVVVRADSDGYELVMGERRLRAAAAAGLTVIPAIVRNTDDDAMLRDALLENIHRAQLNPLEEAAAYQQLLEEFGVTHEDLAARIGRSRPQVSNTIRLLNLSVPVQRRVAAGILSAGHARALLALDDPQRQDDLAGRIVAEGLSVRATEELVALAQHDRGAAPRRRVTSGRITAPALTELAAGLSDALETHVRVDLGRRKGRITVEFGSIDDLERIVSLISPQVIRSRRGRTGAHAGDEAADEADGTDAG